MAVDRLQRLSKLADSFPATDARAVARENAALNLQLSQGVASAAPTSDVTKAGQQIAGLATQAKGQQAVASAQQSAQNLAGIGQAAVGAQEQAAQSYLSDRSRAQDLALGKKSQLAELGSKIQDISSNKYLTQAELDMKNRVEAQGLAFDERLSALTIKQREDLSKLGQDVKMELFDKNQTFEKDELGRKFSNERQLADYAVATARSNEELADKMQSMEQASNRENMLYEAMMNKISTTLELESRGKISKLNRDTRLELERTKQKIEQRMRDRKAKGNNIRLIAQGVGMVGGATAGFMMGGPLGAITGAQLGSEAGKAVGGAVADKNT